MKKLVFGTCVFFLGIVAVVSVLELIARKLWHKKYIEWLGTQLHGYDYVDKEKSLIIPKPNTVKTVSQHRADLQRHGKALGLKFFDAAHKQNILSDTEIIFQINSHGFKGPEFIIPKPDSHFPDFNPWEFVYLGASERLLYLSKSDGEGTKFSCR